MGLIAHPGEVTDLAVSCDGQYVITAGGADNSIHLWKTQVSALDTAAGGTAASSPTWRSSTAASTATSTRR